MRPPEISFPTLLQDFFHLRLACPRSLVQFM